MKIPAFRLDPRLKALVRPDPVPAAVRQLLEEPALVARLLGLVRRMSGYANLTKDDRRVKTLALARLALAEEGYTPGDHDLSLLVALLYARVRAETPFLIAPEPIHF